MVVLRIRIRIRIHMFLGLLDPDPLVRGMDPWIQIRIRIHTKMSWICNTALWFSQDIFFTKMLVPDLYSWCKTLTSFRQRWRRSGSRWSCVTPWWTAGGISCGPGSWRARLRSPTRSLSISPRSSSTRHWTRWGPPIVVMVNCTGNTILSFEKTGACMEEPGEQSTVVFALIDTEPASECECVWKRGGGWEGFATLNRYT